MDVQALVNKKQVGTVQGYLQIALFVETQLSNFQMSFVMTETQLIQMDVLIIVK